MACAFIAQSFVGKFAANILAPARPYVGGKLQVQVRGKPCALHGLTLHEEVKHRPFI
jgi:hypothetical protein